jgi:tRNA-specific 2-thiouridylase
MSDELIAEKLNWIAIPELTNPMRVHAKIRQQHRESEALISLVKAKGDKTSELNVDNVLVKFKEAQRAISPGQTIVFYDSDIVVGGGLIKQET